MSLKTAAILGFSAILCVIGICATLAYNAKLNASVEREQLAAQREGFRFALGEFRNGPLTNWDSPVGQRSRSCLATI